MSYNVFLHVPLYKWAVLGQNWLQIGSDFMHIKSGTANLEMIQQKSLRAGFVHEMLISWLAASFLVLSIHICCLKMLLQCSVMLERDWQYLGASVWHHTRAADGCVKTERRVAWALWISASLDHLSELRLAALLSNHTGWVKLQSYIKSDRHLKWRHGI